MTTQPTPQPLDTLTVTLTAPRPTWQAFVDFCDGQGIHRIVRPFLDQIMTQAQQQEQAPVAGEMQDRPSPSGRGRWQKPSEEAAE